MHLSYQMEVFIVRQARELKAFSLQSSSGALGVYSQKLHRGSSTGGREARKVQAFIGCMGSCSGLLGHFRGTSLIRKRLPLRPYRRPIARALWCPRRGGVFLCARYPCRGLLAEVASWLVDGGWVARRVPGLVEDELPKQPGG
jgi:hypothetical protein